MYYRLIISSRNDCIFHYIPALFLTGKKQQEVQMICKNVTVF